MNHESLIGGHILKKFDEELEELRSLVLKMGGLVEKQVNDGVNGLINSDSEISQKVADSDYLVNAMEVDIDERCVKILAQRQPAAGDLRLVMTVIKTITELERIGDQAEKLGVFELELIDEGTSSCEYAKLEHLGELTCTLLHNALDAFARMDDKAALKVIKKDGKIDNEYEALTRQLITVMMEDPRTIKHALRVMWCARALERIGDHATNICESVLYLVYGKDMRHTDYKDLKNQIKEANK